MECAGNGRAQPRAPADQPALAGRGGRYGRVDRRPLHGGAGSGRGRPGGGRRRLHRGRSRHRAGGGTGLPAQPAAAGPVDRSAARVRDERADLPPQHGYPLRLIVPGWYGMAHVKWLTRIELVDHAFTGFQQSRRLPAPAAPRRGRRSGHPDPPAGAGDPAGIPRLHVPAPGRPAGAGDARGAGLVGRSPVERVEVSVDDGKPLVAGGEPRAGGRHPWAWRRWTTSGRRSPGQHRIAARADDRDGEVQPDDPAWSRGGFSNNAAQRVEVVCAPS